MQKLTDLLIATRNHGKIHEFAEMLAGLPVVLRTLSEFPEIPEVEETGASFAENAALKARFYARRAGLWALADDSGLEVEALGGAPGIMSARYAGAGATDAQRNERLLAELRGAPGDDRRARFVCVIACAAPSSAETFFFTGVCAGHITKEPRGTGGFGYDPLFVPEHYAQSFGELPTEIKNQISHRARALRAATSFLRQHVPER